MFVGVSHKGMTIIDQKLEGSDLLVKVDKYPDKWFQYSAFLKGCPEKKISKHEGKIIQVRHGSYTILTVDLDDWATVQFDNGYTTKVRTGQAVSGNVKNPYYPTVQGIGYPGEGLFSVGTHPVEYGAWVGMLSRARDNENICVHEEWKCFQNFCSWYIEEVKLRKLPETKLVLDKDISGEMLYSPRTSFLVPTEINSLFTSSHMKKLVPLPVGVTFSRGKYKAMVNNNTKKEVIGWFDNPIAASNAYTKRKAEIWKEAASRYRDELCDRCYEAIINKADEVLK